MTDTLTVARNPLAVLDDEGMVVNYDGWGLGCLKYKFAWEDAGVEMPPKAAKLIKRPPAYAIPEDYAMKLIGAVQSGREAFAKWSMPQDAVYQAFGSGWRWVPWSAQGFFEESMAHAEEMLANAKQLVADEWDLISADVEAALSELAVNAERQLSAVRGVPLPWNFRDRVVRAGLARIPSFNAINAIGLCYKCPPPESMAAFKARGGLRVEALGEEQVKALAVKEIVRIEIESKRLMAADERAAKQRQLEIKLQAQRDFVAKEFDPLREAMQYVRGELIRDVRELLAVVEKNGSLGGSSLTKIGNMIEWFRAFNVGNDGEMERLIDRLEAYTAKPKRGQARDTEAFVNTLADMVRVSQEATRDAASTGRFSQMIVRHKRTEGEDGNQD